MKILTYNIWNHDSNFERRLEMLAECIAAENVDLLALQEVRSEYLVHELMDKCGFKYVFWKKYHDCEEGLAVLTNYEILSTWTNWDESIDVHNSGSVCLEIECGGKRLSVSNVHLDYRCALNREIEIIKLTDYIRTLNTDYNLLMGDFNTDPQSSIHGFLSGRQSLHGKSARWIDLGESYSKRQDLSLEVTIDYFNNPRWKNETILDIPGRFDWILLENPYPNPYPALLDYKLVGKNIKNGITPSDHYGVLCQMGFDNILL